MSTTATQSPASKRPRVPRAPRKSAKSTEESVPSTSDVVTDSLQANVDTPNEIYNPSSSSEVPANVCKVGEDCANDSSESSGKQDKLQLTLERVQQSLAELQSSSLEHLGKKHTITSQLKKSDALLKKAITQAKNTKKPRTMKKKGGEWGFTKKGRETEDISKFAGWSTDENKSRVDVMQSIYAYIREHELQKDSSDKRIVFFDKTLCDLFGFSEGTVLSFTDMQKHIQRFIVKDDSPVSA
jgi:chromatin remodeling complex protein RSC6